MEGNLRKPMTERKHVTRRRVLHRGAIAGALGLGAVGTATAAPGKGDERGSGKTFRRVYANDVLWRTNVVKVLDEAPDPADVIYFLHDGERPIVARDDVSAAQRSPFVSESAPGDQDWNGGQWIHVNAEVTDVDAFAADIPVASASDVLEADYIETSPGRPGFSPPDFFICPLNGRA
jgi:hypothetical protein